MPFADDVRKYTFASLNKLVNNKGEVVTKHPYKPTNEQLDAMENFVDALNLMEAGEEDDEGYVQMTSSTQQYLSSTEIVELGMRQRCRITQLYIV